MFTISALPSTLTLDGQWLKAPSFGRDKTEMDAPYADKVSLSGGRQEADPTYQQIAKINTDSMSWETSQQNKEKNNELKDTDRLAKLMQQVLDAKMGVDRKKLEEIEEKIEALANKEGELTDAEKAQLDMLQKQKEQLVKEGAKKLTEDQS